MKNKVKITEQLARELHHDTTSDYLKEKLEAQVPLLRRSKIEEGKWYRYKDSKCLAFVVDLKNRKAFGFNESRDWKCSRESNGWSFGYEPNKWKEAKDEEVLEALSAEARKRGLFYGVEYKSLLDDERINSISVDEYSLRDATIWNDGGCLMLNGKWAELYDEKSEEIKRLEEQIEVISNKIKSLKSE